MMTPSPFKFKIITKQALESKTISTMSKQLNLTLTLREMNSMTHWKAIRSKWCSPQCRISQKMGSLFMKELTLLVEMIFRNIQMITKHFMPLKCACLMLIIMRIRKAKKYLPIIIIPRSILKVACNLKFLKKFPRRYLYFLIIKRIFKTGNY
jgi:hypothetical protein